MTAPQANDVLRPPALAVLRDRVAAWLRPIAAALLAAARWFPKTFDRVDLVIAAGLVCLGYGISTIYTWAHGITAVGAILLLVGIRAAWR